MVLRYIDKPSRHTIGYVDEEFKDWGAIIQFIFVHRSAASQNLKTLPTRWFAS